MGSQASRPLCHSIDCLQIPVPDLETGLACYRDRLGHELIWQTDTSAGLRMRGSDTEIVIQTERPELEVNLTVDSADEAVLAIIQARGRVLAEPFDIPIGRCAVVTDPSGNQLVLLDTSKGFFLTDADGHVLIDEGKPRVSQVKRLNPGS